MPRFIVLFIAACAGLLLDAPRVYADAAPDPPGRPCRPADVGKPCLDARRDRPEICTAAPCDTGEDPRIIRELKEKEDLCYHCEYDAVADAPNRKRRERERALLVALGEREERFRDEERRAARAEWYVLGISLVLSSVAIFLFRGRLFKKS